MSVDYKFHFHIKNCCFWFCSKNLLKRINFLKPNYFVKMISNFLIVIIVIITSSLTILLLTLFNKGYDAKKYKTLTDLNQSNFSRPLIIDAFTYFQESLMLSIRLNRMTDFVDYFIIVVSNTTHSGLPLQISFSPFESYIEKYRHKIIFYNISFSSNLNTSWSKEIYQRVSICNAIKASDVSKNSIVIISDLDEIPTSDAMKYIINNPPKILYMLSGFMYYYNYRNQLRDIWPGVIVVKASNCNNDVQKYRDNRYSLKRTNSIPVNPSQTHCSYCYDKISSIQKKLHSFAHTEYNKPPYTDREYIKDCIKKHLSIFDRGKFMPVKYDPKLLPLPNDPNFNYLKEEFGIK